MNHIESFCVYRIICQASGKSYIGITRTSLDRRWNQHRSDAKSRRQHRPLYAAILKYGESQFSKELLCCARSWNDLCKLEEILIRQWNTLVPHGYNISSGGEGKQNVFVGEETRRKLSIAGRGRISWFRGKIPWNKGKNFPLSIRQKMSQAHCGKPLSEETKKKMSETQSKRTTRWYHTEESRRKISDAMKGKPWSVARRAAHERNSLCRP